MVSQTKSEWGLTKQAMSPKFSSIVVVLLFLILLFFVSLLDVNSTMNLSSKSSWADINLGKKIADVSLSIISNYVKPNHHFIYYKKPVNERERYTYKIEYCIK